MSPDVNGLFESFGKVKQKDDENATRVVSNIFIPTWGNDLI